MILPPRRLPACLLVVAQDLQADEVPTRASKADRANSRRFVNLIVCEVREHLRANPCGHPIKPTKPSGYYYDRRRRQSRDINHNRVWEEDAAAKGEAFISILRLSLVICHLC